MPEFFTRLRTRAWRRLLHVAQRHLPPDPPPLPTPAELLEQQLQVLSQAPRRVPGSTSLMGWDIDYVDAATVSAGVRYLVMGGANDFGALTDEPHILDCGANIGISVLRYKQLYPKAHIVAFEPDPEICDALRRNIERNKLQDVIVVEAAVWNVVTNMDFLSDGADGGHILTEETPFQIGHKISVATIRLADYLEQPVDFVKIDIEGAELTVLQDCASQLGRVTRIVVEPHYHVSQPSALAEILCLLEQSGFKVSIVVPFAANDPRIDLRTLYRPNSNQNADLYPILYGWR